MVFFKSSVFVVNVPRKEIGKPEVMAAKEDKIKNVEAFETFIDVNHAKQESIGCRWIVAKKEVIQSRVG